MALIGRFKALFAIALSIVLCVGFAPASAEAVSGLSGDGGGSWTYSTTIRLREPIGLARSNEPVEVTLRSPAVKSGGIDIRMTDTRGAEIPVQVVSADDDNHIYQIAFLANVAANATADYEVHFGNAKADTAGHPVVASTLNTTSSTWETPGVYIKWGGLSGYNNGLNYIKTYPITKLRFADTPGVAAYMGLDRIVSGTAWDTVYGWLGSDLNGFAPGDFRFANASVTQGPVFAELKLGNATIRSYFGNPKWIQTNNWPCASFNPWRECQYMKAGTTEEFFIPDWGARDISQWMTGYVGPANPGYMAFRNANNGLVLGGVAVGAPFYNLRAKYSAGWDRTIYFGDAMNYPNAKIWWYSDLSNSYDGIDRFSKSVLNPLQPTIIVDTTPPVTQARTMPAVPDGPDGYFVTAATVELTANEPATAYYRWDDGAWSTYGGPISVPDGIHRLDYYSVDRAGNTESAKHLDLKSDLSAPSPSELVSPVDGWAGEVSPVTFAWQPSVDDGLGIASYELVIDGRTVSELAAWQTSMTIADLQPGMRHSWFVRARDRAGHAAESATRWFALEEKAPVVIKAPETFVFFDPAIKDLTVEGRDGEETLRTERSEESLISYPEKEHDWKVRTYKLIDRAGKTVFTLLVQVKREGHELKAFVSRWSDEEGRQVAAPFNSLKFEWAAEKSDDLKMLNQRVSLENEAAVKARFDRKASETLVRSEGSPGVSRPGVHPVKLVISNGKMRVEY